MTIHKYPIASMRPRPRGRGITTGYAHAGLDVGASMRPRPRGRGIAAARKLHPASFRRFNEATTARSWNWRKS